MNPRDKAIDDYVVISGEQGMSSSSTANPEQARARKNQMDRLKWEKMVTKGIHGQISRDMETFLRRVCILHNFGCRFLGYLVRLY